MSRTATRSIAGGLASSSNIAPGTLRSPASVATRLKPALWPAAPGAHGVNRKPKTRTRPARGGVFATIIAFGAESFLE